ncbi:MAG TPA: hypothetical protein VGW10_13005 [Solirubrobacteraceae bacterium]|nr:hypothetical protein [Solirubrobacteraceae bacterium]
MRALQRTAGNGATARWLAGGPGTPGRALQRVRIDDEDYETVDSLERAGLGSQVEEGVEADVVAALVKTAGVYDAEEWAAEVAMRTAVIEGMQILQDSAAYNYNFEAEGIRLPEPWEGTGRDREAAVPKQATSTAYAVDAIFGEGEAPPLPDKPAYFLDCSSTMVAVYYRGMLKALGPNVFAKRFKREHVVVNVEGLKEVEVPGVGRGTPPSHELWDSIKLDALDKLLPGDWVYFENYSDYDETHDGPAAVWAGEHAVVLANGTFRGLGAEGDYETMVGTLRDGYNNPEQGLKQGVKKKKDKELEPSKESMFTGHLPGITEVRRMKNPIKHPTLPAIE